MSKKHFEATVVEYHRNGDTDELHLRQRPLNAPAAGEVMIEVVASGISHIDGFIRSGRETEWQEPFPRRSGSDFAGIIVEVGPGVVGFPSGSEVIGHVRSGAYASFIVVPVRSIIPKPKNVGWEVAGGNFDYLRQLGVTPVRYGDGIWERIVEATLAPVTCFFDNFGQDGRELAKRLGVPGARYRSSADRRHLELRLLQDDADAVEHGTRKLQRLAQYAADRAFTLLISGFYPLEAIGDAYADLQNLHSRGKVVLGMHPVTKYRSLKARDVQEAGA